jgi:RNA polymerase sigma-70 factor (ECF subfamily)
MTVATEFERQTDPLRRDLLAHCYRMLGCVQDAEDLVQETLLRAWKAYGAYDESRASMRTWLHRIATNACLTALAGRARRPLPAGVGQPGTDPEEPFRPSEITWLQPIPDTMLDPATVIAARGTLRLALLAALQHLPARQRAVLILREVLDWSAAEVAVTLRTSVPAVNSALQRARARLAGLGVAVHEVDEPADAEQRAQVDQYLAAFERADVAALTRLLTADAVLEMPPMLNWYAGRDAYGAFLARVFRLRGTDWRAVPVGANGQPAFAAYVRQDGGYEMHTLQVFTVGAAGISRGTVFADRRLFDLFRLPPTLLS